MATLVFCPTYRFEPETREALFAQEWDGAMDWYFTRDNPYPQDDGGRKNILHNYQKGRRMFLGGSWDALWVVESDIIPPPDALRKLASLDADLAYGLYTLRAPGAAKPCNVARFVVGPFPDSPLTLFPEEYRKAWGNTVQCSGLGLGCVLIRRSVLEAIDFRTEEAHCDSAFTKDAWRAGFKMMADMSVICGHKRPDGLIFYPTESGRPHVEQGVTEGYRGAVDDPTHKE